nr:uncharacterized protein LOC111844775 isoform X6 [Paramormyrops kingsleyae]
MVTLLLLLCLVDHLPAVFEADFSVSPGETVTLPCDGGTDKDISEVEEAGCKGLQRPHLKNQTVLFVSRMKTKTKKFLMKTLQGPLQVYG